MPHRTVVRRVAVHLAERAAVSRTRPPTERWLCTRCTHTVALWVTARQVPTCTCGRGLKPQPMIRQTEELK